MIEDDDPVQALTEEDRAWLVEHGWKPRDYPEIGTERIIER